tara:strand:- start:549 stop:1298 length:750 start_codon:yes stop_codon:yes gene_type:complete
MQKTINNIHKLTVYQHKSGIIFKSPDDSFSFDVNSKNFESDILNSISKFNIDKIELIFFSSIPSIVPSKLFDEKLSNRYLETNTSIKENIQHELSMDKKIAIVYSYDKLFINILNKKNIKYSIINYFTVLYNYLFEKDKISDGLSLYINLNEDSFDILIFNSKEFIYFNSFDIKDKNEFLYYLFFVIKNYEISNEKDKIIFLGRYEQYSEYYEIANKYSKLDYIHDDSTDQFNSKSPFFSYLNEDNFRK